MSSVRGGQGRTLHGGVTAAVAGCLLLAGCIGGGSSTPVSSTTVAPTATSLSPTPTPSVSAPAVPAAAQVGTRAGAEAFFRYFWDIYNYSYRTLDAAALDAVSGPGCKFCAQSRKDLTDATSSNRAFEGGSLTLDLAVVAPVDADGGALVNAIATQYYSCGSAGSRCGG